MDGGGNVKYVVKLRQQVMEIRKILALFGLREIEIDLYEKLFYGGSMPASVLAKQAGISRTSVYDLLKRLIDIGLIIETTANGAKSFMAQPPEKLKLLLEEKEKAIAEAQQLLPEIQNAYQQRKGSVRPRFQVFEGKEALQQMVKDLLLYKDITAQVFWSVKKPLDLLSPGFFAQYHEKRVKSNIRLQAIWPKEQIPTNKNYPFLSMAKELKRDVRIAPAGLDFSMGYAIYGNTVRFVSNQKENFGFLVESQELADTMRSQFKVIWSISKPIK